MSDLAIGALAKSIYDAAYSGRLDEEPQDIINEYRDRAERIIAMVSVVRSRKEVAALRKAIRKTRNEP